jgi:hypothetical protein
MKKFRQKISLLLMTTLIGGACIAQSFDGYALYNLQNNNTAYLIDENGDIAHSWSCNVSCNYSVLLKENGNIVRGGVYSSNQLQGAAVGGMVQEIAPNGSVVWEYVHSTANYVSHHDISLMDNGNVLMTAWNVRSIAECTQAGVDGATAEQWPTSIIEVQQNGTGGQVVWEWHIWDHFIQDFDASKDNYGVIADHPELMDINLISVSSGGGGGPGPPPGGDWFHVNGVDYNETLDQIVFSSRFTNEIYIIDHSTNTAEAAVHTGGNAGMGGDFLYRWGNPSNYGASGAQTIAAAVHDPRWIEDGRPNAGYIQFFNNEGGSGGNSAVDAINPALNGYNYTMTGTSYGPSTYDWRHDCLANSSGQSAHNRMTNGNTFVNVSNLYMYEVDASDNVVWQYNAGPTKAFRYECDHPGLEVILGADHCGLLSVSEFSEINAKVYPNPSAGIFNIENVDNATITVLDIYGKVIKTVSNTNQVDLSNQAKGIYIMTIAQEGYKSTTKRISLLK